MWGADPAARGYFPSGWRRLAGLIRGRVRFIAKFERFLPQSVRTRVCYTFIVVMQVSPSHGVFRAAGCRTTSGAADGRSRDPARDLRPSDPTIPPFPGRSTEQSSLQCVSAAARDIRLASPAATGLIGNTESPGGGMVDTRDLKSLGCKAVRVRAPPRAPYELISRILTKETFQSQKIRVMGFFESLPTSLYSGQTGHSAGLAT